MRKQAGSLSKSKIKELLAPYQSQLPANFSEYKVEHSDIPEALSVNKERPFFPGCAIATINSTTHGTLGAIVEKDGKKFILSCYHVLYDLANNGLNKEIVQPRSSYPDDQIAYFNYGPPLIFDRSLGNDIDAALASVIDTSRLNAAVPFVGDIHGYDSPNLGDEVLIYDVFDGIVKYGVIGAKETDITVTFMGNREAVFKEVFRLKGSAENIPSFKAEPGHSGSLVIRKDRDSNNQTKNIAVGLIFAGFKPGGNALLIGMDKIVSILGFSFA